MTATENEIQITSENFNNYFKDVRKHKPEKNDVMAKYTATAEFVDGGEKRQIISLLIDTEDKMEATSQIMRKLLFASELDSYKIPRLMTDDLLSGMSRDDCAKKPYKFTLEMFFYTKQEYIPKDDPHWCCISLVNLDGRSINDIIDGVEIKSVFKENPSLADELDGSDAWDSSKDLHQEVK